MLQTYKDIVGLPLALQDESFGRIVDIYFDDKDWDGRYAVVDIGSWFEGREGLVNIEYVGKPDLKQRRCPVSLTKEQVENAPKPESDPPVNAQIKKSWGKGVSPAFLISYASRGGYSPALAEMQVDAMMTADDETQDKQERHDPHLRSMSEIMGYCVKAPDGKVGVIQDALIDPETWEPSYFVVDTGSWLPGKQVILSKDWIEDISWDDRAISVAVPKEFIESSPEVSDLNSVDRDHLNALYVHYGYHPMMM